MHVPTSNTRETDAAIQQREAAFWYAAAIDDLLLLLAGKPRWPIIRSATRRTPADLIAYEQARATLHAEAARRLMQIN